jgi:hypothetical protein
MNQTDENQPLNFNPPNFIDDIECKHAYIS